MPKLDLAIVTSVTRMEVVNRILESFSTLVPHFNYIWFPNFLVAQPKAQWPSIGAAWNQSIELVHPDHWCILLDDDNGIHPEFGSAFHRAVDQYPQAEFFILKGQREKDEGIRSLTVDPQLRRGKIDAAQLAFKARVAQGRPFPDTSHQPDGAWAEHLSSTYGGGMVTVEVPTYYNRFR